MDNNNVTYPDEGILGVVCIRKVQVRVPWPELLCCAIVCSARKPTCTSLVNIGKDSYAFQSFVKSVAVKQVMTCGEIYNLD